MASRLTFKAARVLHGLSQCELANQLGVTQQTIAKYETGKSLPRDFTTIKKIAKILEKNPREIFPDLFDSEVTQNDQR